MELVSWLIKKFLHLMETDGSLPCSKGQAAGWHPDPEVASPHHHHPLSSRSNLMLSFHLRPDPPTDFLLSDFPTKFLLIADVLHAIKRRKANWIGHSLRRNYLLKHIMEGKI
jgi:hypothetical protein